MSGIAAAKLIREVNAAIAQNRLCGAMVLGNFAELAFECGEAESGPRRAVAYVLACLAERLSGLLEADPEMLHSTSLKIADTIREPLRGASSFLAEMENDEVAMDVVVALATADVEVAKIVLVLR